MIGAVHALAYPSGGKFHLPHGLTNTLMLPYVMRYNTPGCPDGFARSAKAFGEKVEGFSDLDAAEAVVKSVEGLSNDPRVPRRLIDAGVSEKAIPA